MRPGHHSIQQVALCAPVFLASLALSLGTAHAQEWEDYYLGGTAGYVLADDGRAPDADAGSAAGVYFGRVFDNQFGFEVHVSGDGFETGTDLGSDLYRYLFGADAIYNFGDRRGWSPFAALGGGGSYNDVVPSAEDTVDFFANAAVGLVSPAFTDIGQLRVRAEARYVHDFFGDGFGDLRLMAGIEIPLLRPAEVSFEAPETQIEIVEVPSGLQDSDGDGVINERDLCPNTPPGTRIDGDGCPFDDIMELRGVTFELDSARLRPDAETVLSYVVDILQRNPDMEVEIAGHTCDLGSEAYNRSLSQQRAQSVVDHLQSRGIDGARMEAVGYGESEPQLPNTSEENRERNRRVEMRVLN
ncbi:OmpA family protein [Algiphilus sp.]|uniref:OmpA family protein n=1 Tax=Algiphilus sp. TaxID=1872431 RepID=UPI001CA62957|nr:OmpA family protein [Algiphilus sp.]MBY8964756.1 OmpA family protein [Algiphilus acroporae]MCI5061566.1 OmpA family protein [Algiphilus sp.]MCI5103675.1 OmpA family protein [Algiphilus sp.]MCR9091738.1 OmpA family protein [Pseudomonadota bacterium]